MHTAHQTEVGFRFGIRGLMLAMLHCSLFLGAVAWAIRGPDAGVERLFDGWVDMTHDSGAQPMLLAAFTMMPAVFIAGWVAIAISIGRLGRRPYSGFLLLGFAIVGIVAVGVWFAAGGRESALVVARLALPLAASAAALAIETAWRKLPTPYWGVTATAAMMTFVYVGFIVAVWSCGGKA